MSALAQVRTARVLAAARWRGLRSPGARFAMWVGFVACLLMVAVTSKLGDVLREAARPMDSQGDAARTVLGFALEHPERVWALALAGAAATSLMTLATHTGNSRLLAAPLGALVRTGHLTRYLESVGAAAISVVPALQLATLTGAASVLTADGQGRPRVIATAMALVVVLHLLQVGAAWAATLLPRTRRARWTLTGAGVAVGAVAALSWQHLLSAAWWLLDGPAALAGASVAVAGLAALCGGLWACAASANVAPARVAGQVRSVRIPTEPFAAARASLAVPAMRSAAVRSGMTMALLATVALVAFARDVTVVSVAVIVPLAWSLTFTSNFLAAHGRGAAWISSLPSVAAAMARAGAQLAVAVPAAVLVVAGAGIAVLAPDQLVSFALAAPAAVALLAGLSVHRAVRRPVGAGIERGGPLVPDSVTLVELVRLGVASGVVWGATTWPVLVAAEESHMVARVAATLILTGTGAGLLMMSIRSWHSRSARALAQAGTE
ncbi:hypothetical protein [Cellulosimicrobium sp. Marseille-Q4280]|uniref:hypothetical protein n=1 Tax=Cellulosimicrobium sp. Marseille-Q4280 TaxID=2937992 RepID=UPI002041CBF0|nr:hypothetical protein [Cellulosimicrobium sp. Marseille-Q4280]